MKRNYRGEVDRSNGSWAGQAEGGEMFRRRLPQLACRIWRLMGMLLRIPVSLVRCCVAVAVGAISIARTVLLVGIGFLLVASACFGFGCVLLYPLWH